MQACVQACMRMYQLLDLLLVFLFELVDALAALAFEILLSLGERRQMLGKTLLH